MGFTAVAVDTGRDGLGIVTTLSGDIRIGITQSRVLVGGPIKPEFHDWRALRWKNTILCMKKNSWKSVFYQAIIAPVADLIYKLMKFIVFLYIANPSMWWD
jgi:hypothetical protein